MCGCQSNRDAAELRQQIVAADSGVLSVSFDELAANLRYILDTMNRTGTGVVVYDQGVFIARIMPEPAPGHYVCVVDETGAELGELGIRASQRDAQAGGCCGGTCHQ